MWPFALTTGFVQRKYSKVLGEANASFSLYSPDSLVSICECGLWGIPYEVLRPRMAAANKVDTGLQPHGATVGPTTSGELGGGVAGFVIK